MPSSDEFRKELEAQISRARQQGRPHCEINAGELHRLVGGYPNGGDHQMPTCCDILRERMAPSDIVVFEPEQKKGASLTIRYVF